MGTIWILNYSMTYKCFICSEFVKRKHEDSILFGDSCPQDAMSSVKNTLQVTTSAFEEKYLGLPTPNGRMTKGKFQNLQVKISKRLFSYDDHPTQAGKEVLIKFVAQSIPTFIMSVFKIPLGVCDDLNCMVSNYYWGAEDGRRKTHWYAWNKMQRPKSHGGLGFRDFRLFNQALLARQAWRLLTFPDSLRARLLKVKYYPNGRLEDTVFSGNPSPTWQAICHGLELLKKGIVWRIANGQNTRIWRDRWLVREPTGGLITQKGRCRFKWVLELLDHNGVWGSLPIDIESDCLEAVKMVQSEGSNRSRYAFLVEEIKENLKERDSCITHIRRCQNSASHVMANFGRSQAQTAVWLGSGPEEVIDIVRRDCNT